MLLAIMKFPKRFRHFLASCITAEHYFEYRRTIRKLVQNSLATRKGTESEYADSSAVMNKIAAKES
jgi:hypothetical protein